MVGFARFVFGLAIVVLSALGLLGLLPFAKEGLSQDLVPAFLGGIAAFLVLGLLWWLAVRRSLLKALPLWIVLALPVLAYAAATVGLLWAQFNGSRIGKTARIENYSEAPIQWPGFQGPVGWRIAFDLRHPEDLRGLIVPPEVRMGPSVAIPRDRLAATRTNGSGTFKSSYLAEEYPPLALLKTVLFQRRHGTSGAAEAEGAWSAARRFDSSGRTALEYHLYPGVVDFLDGSDRLCLAAWSPGIADCGPGERAESGCRMRGRQITPLDHQGEDLSALWAAFGPNDMVVDLSRPLTDLLRQESRLERDSTVWQAIQQRLSPQNLLARGYDLCPPGHDSHNAYRVCYCR